MIIDTAKCVTHLIKETVPVGKWRIFKPKKHDSRASPSRSQAIPRTCNAHTRYSLSTAVRSIYGPVSQKILTDPLFVVIFYYRGGMKNIRFHYNKKKWKDWGLDKYSVRKLRFWGPTQRKFPRWATSKTSPILLGLRKNLFYSIKIQPKGCTHLKYNLAPTL